MKVTEQTRVWIVYQDGYFGTEVVSVCSTEDRAEEIESMAEGRWTSNYELDQA